MKLGNIKYHKNILKPSSSIYNQKSSHISKIRNSVKINSNTIHNTNKTLQKYINQKLNSVTNGKKKQLEKNSHSLSNNKKSTKHIKSNSINRTHNTSISNTSENGFTNKSVNLSKNKSKISRNDNLNKIANQKKEIKGRNQNLFHLNDYNKPFNPNYFFNNNINIFSSHIDTYQLSSLTNNNNTKYSTNNRLIKSPMSSKNKTITIYKKKNRNSSSVSTIFSSNAEKSKKVSEFNENEFLPHFNQENSPLNTQIENKNSATNNYESDSIDLGNKIYLKVNENCSLTFGNSFSYSNSKMSSSTKKIRDENENLKKELEESNAQILLLKNEIEELMKKNTTKNSKVNFKCLNNINNNKIKKKNKNTFKNYSKEKEKGKKIRTNK